ncbi:MAG TPA: OmpA family protein [Kofleriaceae bacterium]|nr:OmpA family protein [Kofleriaceae bacterium]
MVFSFAAALSFSTAARAQDAQGNTFSLQLFRPAVDSKGYFTVNASQILGHLDFSIGLIGSYARDVLVLRGPAETRFAASDLVTAQLQGALGLWKWAEIGLSLPVHILFGGRGPSYVNPANPNLNSDLTFGAQMVGDLGIHPKVRLLNTSKYPVGLAVVTSIYVPTGDAKRFLGEGNVTLRPELVLDKEFGFSRRFRMALNVGALIRFDRNTFTDRGTTLNTPGSNIDPSANGGNPFCYPAATTTQPPMTCGTGQARTLGTQLTYGLGLSGAVVPQRFELLLELYGQADLTGAANAFPLEWLAGGKVYLAARSYFQFGAGTGIVPDQTGSPRVRAFIGFIFEPSIGDRDGDGIKDDVDKCPDDPEDRDDFEDEDGCPDPDNDRDQILDKDDKCPNEPETRNGYEDDDGCPDTVDLDRDGDRIPDRLDKCPDDPEDFDHFEDDDGCPDPDNDKDRILDIDDLCPNDPEDRDQFEDEDGCPDPDNDKDRILDKDDKCPNQPEIYNGVEDEDGCPDKGRTLVRKGRVQLMDPIHFETAKAVIRPISFPILNALTATLKGNPQIKLIEVQGHADERGDDDYNMRLTEDRAQAVKQYLLDHGLEAERIKAHGYGETKPVCRARGDACWSRNRRVEFIILRQEGTIPGQQ